MAQSALTDNDARLLAARQVLSGRVWSAARWCDGRKVIATAPGGNLLSDIVLVMPAEARARLTPDGWVGAEAIETTWEGVAVVMMTSKTFGPGNGVRRLTRPLNA
jgi:hypothetical protein